MWSRWLIALVAVAWVALGDAPAAQVRPATRAAKQPATRPAAGAKAAVIVMRGVVDAYNRSSLERRVALARAAGAQAIIVEIDTPGGELGAMLGMSRLLKTQTDVYMMAFVNPYAFSAGAVISAAADEIVMAPGGLIGASSVLVQDQQGQIQNLPGDVRDKLQSPVISDLHDSAARNGYDPLLLQAMVQQIVLHWVQGPDGQRKFVDDAQYAKLIAQGWKPVPGVPDPLDIPRPATLSADLAVRFGLASGTARSADEIATSRGWTIVARLEPSLGDQIVGILSNAVVRGLLLTVFLTALYAALHAPGHGFAEVIAVVTLGALIGVPLLTGYAQWWEILLILVGLVLLAIEVFVLPGFGVTGISGILLMLIGFIFTFAAPEPGSIPGILPSLPGTWDALRTGLVAVVVGMFASLLLSMWLRRFLPRLPYFNKLILTTTVGSSPDGSGQVAIAPPPAWPLPGMTGRAVTDLKPGGSAEFADGSGTQVISVVSDSGYVPHGSAVVVKHVEGTKVVVRQMN